MANAGTSTASSLTPGVLPNLRADIISGFLVFLIALPLCLGIATACKFPPIAGIWTAVLGGILGCLFSNSALTIKGPAAGLIVIIEGAVLELGREFAPEGADIATIAMTGYPLALGIGVTAGIIQILLGLIKAGKLADLVPLTPVHGMLAAIGITIIAKQFFRMVGLTPPDGEPIYAILALPNAFLEMNLTISIIGFSSLLLLFGFPILKNYVPALKAVPGQLVVLVVAVPLGVYFGLGEMLNDQGKPKFLVNIPNVIPAVFTDSSVAFMFPNFAGLVTTTGLKYVLLFALIGSIESLLSAKAVDLIDPWKRKTDMNRDLLAVGLANTVCSFVGALPMISEIVRSKANADNGGRTKMANLFHGLFLLGFVLAVPGLIRLFPMAALGAMLVYTGFRLASPKEFMLTWKIGREQFIVFIATIIVTLCTDLLIGVLVGIGLKGLIHVWNGAPLKGLFWSDMSTMTEGDDKVTIMVRKAALFSNWLGLRKAIITNAVGRRHVVVDLSHTTLVDHSVMEKLHELEEEFHMSRHCTLSVIGLDDHRPFSQHPLATRKKVRRQSIAPVAS